MESHSVICHPTEIRIQPLPSAKAGTRFSDPGGMQGWVNLCYVKAATCKSQVQSPTAKPPCNTLVPSLLYLLYVSKCIDFQYRGVVFAGVTLSLSSRWISCLHTSRSIFISSNLVVFKSLWSLLANNDTKATLTQDDHGRKTNRLVCAPPGTEEDCLEHRHVPPT